MGGNSNPTVVPKLVKVNKSLKLAEAWVNNMSGSTGGELNEVAFEGRPPRLGLGAKVVRNSNATDSNDPVERRLLGKLNAAKRRISQNLENDSPANDGDSSEEDDEPESRTSIAAKKRTVPSITPSHSKKKKRLLKS